MILKLVKVIIQVLKIIINFNPQDGCGVVVGEAPASLYTSHPLLYILLFYIYMYVKRLYLLLICKKRQIHREKRETQ